MYIITKSHFDDFVVSYGYGNIPVDEAFEKFIIYSVASKYIRNQTITKSHIDDINIGQGNDWGIDGLLIIVNGRIITTKQDVDDMLRANGYLDVQFVFMQAKNVESLDVGELGKALDGVEYIFKEIAGETNLPACNADLTAYRAIIKYIYSYNAKFKDGKEAGCDFYYAYTGLYNAQADFTARLNKAKTEIDSLSLTQPFYHEILDRQTIVDFYKETKSKNEVSIQVDQKLDMPSVEKVQESYLCLIPYSEFKKLYIDQNDKLIASVFYDNVRDFQGMNTVNEGIARSLKDGDLSLFTAMNNGITVVVKNFTKIGRTLNLNDYQIVNGCQTCNVLYHHRHTDGIEDLTLVVKIIASKDKTSIDKVIIGNNSQTEVLREQLVSLMKIQHTIEDYYNAQNAYERLYYERRSKQYKNSDTAVPQDKIITIAVQTKAFISMMMGEPHNVRGYYGSIMNQYDGKGKQIYAEATHPAFYYTCALAYYKLNEMFSSHVIDKAYKKIKYHILFAFRLMCETKPLKHFNSNNSQAYCDHICRMLCDSQQCEKAFIAAVKLVNCVLKRTPNDTDGNNADFTAELKRVIAEVNKVNKKKNRAEINSKNTI